MILTDANGVPFDKPLREDFATDAEYLRAIWSYQDRVTNYANSEFADAFDREMRRESKPKKRAA